jgi:ATP-binding cassette subfamily C protein
MIEAIKSSLEFMSAKERSVWYFLTGLRALLSLLDLAGILAIGFVVTSTAIFLTSGSDPDRTLEFIGIQFPAVNAQTLPWVSAGVLALFLAKALLSIILTKRVAFFVAKVEARSAKAIAEICFGGDLGEARKRSSEEVTFAIQVGSPFAFNVLLNALNAFIAEAVLFLVICTGFLLINPIATIAAIAYFGIIAFVMQYFAGSLMNRAGKASAEGTVQANAAISDLLSVFRELLVLGKRDKYIEGIYRGRRIAADSSATQYYLNGMPRYIIEAGLLVGVALFVLAQSLAGDIIQSAATIGVFLSGGFRLTAALLPLQNALLTMSAAIPSAKRSHDILRLRKKDKVKSGTQEVVDSELSISGIKSQSGFPVGIRFEKVCFTYPGAAQQSVKNVSFKFDAGSQVALIGPSGAGKSTIADLVCLALTPSSGSITHFEESGQPVNLTKLVRASYVPQRPGIVAGTILDNVALAEAKDTVDKNRAHEALSLAHLTDLIAELPEGLDTALGNLQDGLSGGQMQRLGLARALYTNPGLLVMDEATSALDAESEGEIQKALDGMRGRVTVLLIAHRLNTIQHADKVVLVEDGEIKDSGTFKELIARNPSLERVVDLMNVEKD